MDGQVVNHQMDGQMEGRVHGWEARLCLWSSERTKVCPPRTVVSEGCLEEAA